MPPVFLLQPRIDGFAFKCEHREDALMHPAKRHTAGESFQSLRSIWEIAVDAVRERHSCLETEASDLGVVGRQGLAV